MEITKSQKTLINGLMVFGVETEAIVGILLALQTEEEILQLTEFLALNREATQSDILTETSRILQVRVQTQL